MFCKQIICIRLLGTCAGDCHSQERQNLNCQFNTGGLSWRYFHNNKSSELPLKKSLTVFHYLWYIPKSDLNMYLEYLENGNLQNLKNVMKDCPGTELFNGFYEINLCGCKQKLLTFNENHYFSFKR